MGERQLTGASWHRGSYDLDAYLAVVGIERQKPDLEFLELLAGAHVATFPFANIDILLGSHPGVEPVSVQRQLVQCRRGGYCFEHAQLFAAVLEDLGFTVARRLGRVHSPYNTRTHMTVAVSIEGEWFLTDPGFGFSIRGPIPLKDGARMDDGGRIFEIRHGSDHGVDLWSLHRDGQLEHVTDALTVQPSDVRSGHLITSTPAAAGPFTEALVVSRLTEEGHITITGRSRTTRRDGFATVHETITTVEAVEGVQQLGVSLVGDEPARLHRVLQGWP